MALEITLHYTDPTTDTANKQPFTIYPGEANTTSTSLTLVGQGTMNYGKHIMEDFLHMLENFCSGTQPDSPTKGQLWYDTASGVMKVLKNITTSDTGVKSYTWGAVGSVHVSNTAPVNREILWYDTSKTDFAANQLKIFDTAQNKWISVAASYVLKTGDTMSGDLTFSATDSGLKGTLSGFTNKITPTSTRGPVMMGGQHATVVINQASPTATGSEFVVGAGTSLTAAVDSNNRLFAVADSGVVTVYKNVLSMNSKKITNLADGTVPTDAATFGQLTTARTNLQGQIDTHTTQISTLGTNINAKVSKSGDTMSGALTINSTLYVGALGTFAGGVSVTGGTLQTNNGAAVGTSLTVGTTLAVTGASTLNSNLTVGGVAQLNSTLTVNGATTLKSALGVTGAATFGNNVSAAGNLTVSGTSTLTGIALMNQPTTAITNAKHLTTKEYVDGKIAAIPIVPVPKSLWAGTTTLANIAATYSDINAYPVGTTVVYTFQWSYTYGTGNGTATGTKTARRMAVRTQNNGWMECDVPPSSYL